MKNINNETKEFFDNLQISKQRKKEIYEEITKKRFKSHNLYRLVLAMSCCFISLLGIISVTYAEELKQSFNTLRVKYFQKVVEDKKFIMTDVKSDSKATINYKADIIIDKKYSYNDITTKLEINILNNSLFKKKDFIIKNIEKIEDNIGFLLLGIDNVFDEHPDQITDEGNIYNHEYIKCDFEVSIATKYSEREPGRVYSSSNKIEEIYINSLDTKAIVARLGGEFSDTIWDVRFDYNNVSYHLELFFFTSGNHRDELLKILNSFNN